MLPDPLYKGRFSTKAYICAMSIRILPVFLYFGLLFLTLGTLFRIQHWECGRMVQATGTLLNLGFFILLLAEVVSSRKAGNGTKVVVGLAYLVFPLLSYWYMPAVLLIFVLLILGSIYLRWLRKRFLFSRQGLNTDDFDSI